MKSKKYSFTEYQVRLSIEGFKIEALVSEIMKRKIAMRSLKYISDTEIHLTVSFDGYERIKRIAGRKYRITVLRENGAVPRIRSMKFRKATLLGLALFFIILYYQSLFVSEIRIYGYEGITEGEIRQALSDIDFEEGKRKLTTKDEINAVKLYLFQRLGDISWVGITYDGTLAEVEIVEGRSGEKNIKDDTPCHIIADKSGYIARVIPKNGVRNVEDGTYVEPGDIIISGIMPMTGTAYGTGAEGITERYVHAEGIVEIYVPHRFEFIITPGLVDSINNKNAESAVFRQGENEYDFVKRVSDRRLRKYIAENGLETARITNKGLNFEVKENIIEVNVFFETLEKIGIKQEIVNGS